MKREVRFVGGESAGETMNWDLNKGDIIEIPVYPNFPVGVLPGDEKCTSEMRVEVYRIHQMRYGTGHIHVFAAPDRWPTAELMNELWHGYKRYKSKKPIADDSTIG